MAIVNSYVSIPEGNHDLFTIKTQGFNMKDGDSPVTPRAESPWIGTDKGNAAWKTMGTPHNFLDFQIFG